MLLFGRKHLKTPANHAYLWMLVIVFFRWRYIGIISHFHTRVTGQMVIGKVVAGGDGDTTRGVGHQIPGHLALPPAQPV